MNFILKIALLVTVTTAPGLASECRAAEVQPDTLVMQFHFRQNDALLLRNYRDNNYALNKLLELRDNNSIDRIALIKITGSSSPNGNPQQNKCLALERAKAVRTYIYWKVPTLNRDLVSVEADADLCGPWLRAVEHDMLVPRRDQVMEILRSETSVTTKWANVQQLKGDAARYLEQTIFPYLCNSMSRIVLLKPLPSEVVDTSATVPPVSEHKESYQFKTTSAVAVDAGFTPVKTLPTTFRKPLFAFKTNLLFSVATMLNLELEVPIGRHWSVAGEVIVPWWLWEKKQHCLQVMSGNIEGKYWFGNRQNRPLLTGWFTGLYAGGGYYDLEWDRTGYQGEFFIALGVSGGYAHAINRRGNLRMEYALGIGYLQTGYRKYEAKLGADDAWHLYRRESGTYKWFGPTRAKISLVWMLDRKGKGYSK